MKLVAGLGNPGPRYADTRHNVGWRVVEELACRWQALPWREKFGAAVIETRGGDQRVALARPQTFMNRSGMAVRQMTDFWRLAPQDVLVVVDDFALDAGRLRLRTEGSAGGHNGLASVVECLGTEAFGRLRVGIGPMPKFIDPADFVLSTFRDDERPVIEETIRRAADAAHCWVTEGPEAAMNRFNRPQDD